MTHPSQHQYFPLPRYSDAFGSPIEKILVKELFYDELRTGVYVLSLKTPLLRSQLTKMDTFKKGWFTERNTLWPGVAQSLEVQGVLYEGQSKHQHVMVLDSKSHGRVLVLDGVIQCTERDEFSYQEMISFLPLTSHRNPERVLIVGGGDGGVAREVAKFKSVKTISQVEIDEDVIKVAKIFLPSMSRGFDDPRVAITIGDGCEFMRDHRDQFDVIITDSSDPIGPAICLYQKSYFELMKRSLRSGGVICSQAGTIWMNLNQVQETFENCKAAFPNVAYAISSVPTYPSGQIGFVLGSLDPDINLREPSSHLMTQELESLNLSYYSPAMHRASFELPEFARRLLQ